MDTVHVFSVDEERGTYVTTSPEIQAELFGFLQKTNNHKFKKQLKLFIVNTKSFDFFSQRSGSSLYALAG